MMTSPSIFDAMEFSIPMEDFLDESFGLSAEILAADIKSEGSFLDSDLGQIESLKYESEQPSSGVLDDMLLPDVADSLGQEWMEKVDLKLLLNNLSDGQSLSDCISLPTLQVSPPEPIPTSNQVSYQDRKEGMRAFAYEKLKALLTDQGQINEPVEVIIPTSPAPTASPQSPEALVPDLPFITPSFDSLLEESSENVLEDLIQLQPADVPLSIVDTGEVLTGEVLSAESSVNIVELLSPVTNVTQSQSYSDLSSGPSSPSDSFTLETVDLTELEADDSVSSSDKGSQISDHEFTRLKSKQKRDRVRPVPYEVDVTCVDNKKDRKKVQNKNAATRYRVKKRQEKETLQQQESKLSDKNKELREKVESLQREISYMKELMNEIYKAKKSKI